MGVVTLPHLLLAEKKINISLDINTFYLHRTDSAAQDTSSSKQSIERKISGQR